MDSLVEYCNRYNGITKIFKLIQAATLLKVPNITQAFETSLILAQKLNIYRIYRYIESTALDWKITTLRIDKNLAAEQFSPYLNQAEKLEKDINMSKNSSNKLSTGLSYIELGNLYLRAGDVTEAYRSYERVYNYYESGDYYSYFPQWSACMIVERRYDQLKLISPKEAIPIEKKKREQHTTLIIFQALRCLYQGDMNEFLLIIKDEIQYDCIVEDENLLLVSSLREIGVFITVCALARQSRSQVQELLKSDSIRFFVTQDNDCLNILEWYISLDYKSLIQKLKILYIEFNQDFIFKRFNITDVVTEKIDQIILVTLQKDPIDEVLVQKVTQKTKKYETYEKAVYTIANFLHKRQRQMLRYHLGIVHNENSFKIKQDMVELGNFHGFSNLSKMVGQFMDMGNR